MSALRALGAEPVSAWSKSLVSLETTCMASEATNYRNVFTNYNGLNKDFFFVASSGGS